LSKTAATTDFTVTVGPPERDCFVATTTVPSSSAGLNVTVPVIAWVEEFANENGVPLELIGVTLVSLGTGPPEMTAVAWLSAVITTS